MEEYTMLQSVKEEASTFLETTLLNTQKDSFTTLPLFTTTSSCPDSLSLQTKPVPGERDAIWLR